VLLYDIGRQRIRAVTHLDVSLEDVQQAGEIIRMVTWQLSYAASKLLPI